MKQGGHTKTAAREKNFAPLFTIISLAVIVLITMSVSMKLVCRREGASEGGRLR
jgi:hypothetical protein